MMWLVLSAIVALCTLICYCACAINSDEEN